MSHKQNQGTKTPVEPKFNPRKWEEKLTPDELAERDRMGADGPMAHVPKPVPRKRS